MMLFLWKAELGKTEAERGDDENSGDLTPNDLEMELSKEDKDKEKADGVQVLTSLEEFVERGLKKLGETIEGKKWTAEAGRSFIKKLE